MKILNSLILILLFSIATSAQVANEEQELYEQELIKRLDHAFNLSLQSDYNKAIEIARNVLKDTLISNNNIIKGKAYRVLGVAFTDIDAKDGLEPFLIAASFFEKTTDTTSLISSYNNIGYNYKRQKNYKDARSYFYKALQVSQNFDKFKTLVFPAFNYAENIIDFGGNMKEAFKYLNLAKGQIDNIESLNASGEIYKCFAKAYIKTNETEKVLLYINKSITFFEESGHLEGLSEAYTLKADFLKTQRKYSESNAALKKLIKVKSKINNLKQLSITKKIQIEYDLKEHQERYDFLLKEKAAKESLLRNTKIFNIILTAIIGLLLIGANVIYKKNKEFKIARDKAEKLSVLKSKFYSEISHELRTPLYAVIELSSILLKEKVNTKHIEYLKSLNFSGNYLLALIDNVLQLNKTKITELKTQYVSFNLKQLTTSVIDSVEFALNDSNNTIGLKYDPKIPEQLIGDPLKLTQIIMNLVSNAIKFTNNGHIEIEIQNIKQSLDNVNLFFKITDTGKGISKEGQELIFKDFYQDDSTKEKSHKGTGLGLSIVKRILKSIGSEIKIHSVLGEGTTFYFNLDFKTKSSVQPIEEKLETKLNSIKGSRFLIVDDNKVNLLVTKKVLHQYNLECEIANSGLEGISKAKASHFDCILMDLHMPEMDGYETTDKIREFNTNIPIIALTATSIEEVENNIYKHDMNGYVLKPFIASNFIEVISKAINKSRVISA